MSWSFERIGYISSPCQEKFGLPRQSGLVMELSATIRIVPPYDRDEAFEQLTTFTHIWVLSVFHQLSREQKHWQPTVRPPRLGGNARVGVFASRSPNRPNPIGLSVIRLDGIERTSQGLQLAVSGCDLVDGTPVIDIKPYLPYADCITTASNGYLQALSNHALVVEMTEPVRRQGMDISRTIPGFTQLIVRLIEQDPRPAYHDGKQDREYGMRVSGYDVRFKVTGNCAMIHAIDKVDND